MSTPSKIVEIYGERLDLFEPRQADRFIAYLATYRTAASMGWSSEFLLAERIVSRAIWDQSHPEGDEDDFEAWADDQVELEQGDRL